MTEQDYRRWIGRTERREDVISASALDRLSATLDRDDPPHRDGDLAPPLAHWLHFLPQEPQSELGPDGHAGRGGFLPPVHDLPRRMWAGSRLSFPGDLRVGMRVEKRSTITAVEPKEGAAGKLVFVTVRHEIAEPGGPALATDEHDIVYRGLGGPAAKLAAPAPAEAAWSRTLTPDTVLLFRYSALTFNGHRIHYDRTYVTGVEGYPGLVVHGPLMATLLVDLARRARPEARIAGFSFRALSPTFDGVPLTVRGMPSEDGKTADLWVANHRGGLAMKAKVEFGDVK